MNVFDKAIEYLEERGWNQGSASSWTGQICALQALEFARDDLMPGTQLMDLEHILPVTNLVRFNDNRETTYEDVIALLKGGSRRFEDRKGGISL